MCQMNATIMKIMFKLVSISTNANLLIISHPDPNRKLRHARGITLPEFNGIPLAYHNSLNSVIAVVNIPASVIIRPT